MNCSTPIDPKKLDKDILEEFQKESLKKCPLCKEAVLRTWNPGGYSSLRFTTEFKTVCSSGGDIFDKGGGFSGEEYKYGACNVCRIVWELHRQPWEDRSSNEEVLRDSGWWTWLAAYSDCFHRTRLLQIRLTKK